MVKSRREWSAVKAVKIHSNAEKTSKKNAEVRSVKSLRGRRKEDSGVLRDAGGEVTRVVNEHCEADQSTLSYNFTIRALNTRLHGSCTIM